MIHDSEIVRREIRHLKTTRKIKATIEFLNQNFLDEKNKIKILGHKNYCIKNKNWDRIDCYKSIEYTLYLFFMNNKAIFSKWQRENSNSHFYKFIKRHKMKVWNYESLLKHLWIFEWDGKKYYEQIIKFLYEILPEEQKQNKNEDMYKILIWALEQFEYESILLDKFYLLDRNYKLNELRYSYEFCRIKSKKIKN